MLEYKNIFIIKIYILNMTEERGTFFINEFDDENIQFLFDIIQQRFQLNQIFNETTNDNHHYSVRILLTEIEQPRNNISYPSDYFLNCKHINDILGNSQKIKENDEILKSENICNICYDIYEKNQFKRIINQCKHCFHKKCIDKWLKKNASCPVCRIKLC